MLRNISGCVQTALYSCWAWGAKKATDRVSDLLRAHPRDVAVLMQVWFDDRVLNADGTRYAPDIGRKTRPNHIMGLLKPVVWRPDEVTLTAFNHGATQEYKLTPENFKHIAFAYTVGARKSSIDL